LTAKRSFFQFPLSERTNCNKIHFEHGGIRKGAFQFPLSERTNCNAIAAVNDNFPIGLSVSSIGTNELQRNMMLTMQTDLKSFSFLYRNERTATAHASNAYDKIKRAFSFLYRNERTATSA